MTLDEAIKHEEEIAEENQRVVDTGIVFDDVTIDMLYCDDTEVIEEHLANYQRCAEDHRQLAEWLKELKQIREQLRWIPVTERLPKKGEYDGDVAKYYLVQNEFGDMMVATYTYSEYWEQIYQLKPITDQIIAWMSLPKKYEPQEGEEE